MTSLPILIPAKGGPPKTHRRPEGTARFLSEDEPVQECKLIEADEGKLLVEVDVVTVHPKATMALLGPDNRLLRKLQKLWGVIPADELAAIIAVSKLIDAVRLKDDGKLREYVGYRAVAVGKDRAEEAKTFFDSAHPEVAAWISEAYGGPRFFAAAAQSWVEVSYIVSECRLCMWNVLGDRTPRIGILAPHPIAALKLQVVLSLEQSDAVAYCENCQNAYIRTKHGQRFCNLRCGNRSRQARCRAAKK